MELKEQFNIIKEALASGYKGSIGDLIKQRQPEVANTEQQQREGLRNKPEGTSMTFPNSSEDFNTMGMKYPIDITKVDDTGNIVQSYKSVPPGIQNLPMGGKTGTVIESPATYKTGGIAKHWKEFQTGGTSDAPKFLEDYEKRSKEHDYLVNLDVYQEQLDWVEARNKEGYYELDFNVKKGRTYEKDKTKWEGHMRENKQWLKDLGSTVEWKYDRNRRLTSPKYNYYDESFAKIGEGLTVEERELRDKYNWYNQEQDKRNFGYRTKEQFLADYPEASLAYTLPDGREHWMYGGDSEQTATEHVYFTELEKPLKISPKKLKQIPIKETKPKLFKADTTPKRLISERQRDPSVDYHHRKYKEKDGKYYAYNPGRDKNANTRKNKGDGWYPISKNTYDYGIKNSVYNENDGEYYSFWERGKEQNKYNYVKDGDLLDWLIGNYTFYPTKLRHKSIGSPDFPYLSKDKTYQKGGVKKEIGDDIRYFGGDNENYLQPLDYDIQRSYEKGTGKFNRKHTKSYKKWKKEQEKSDVRFAQKGGFPNQFNTNYQESKNYQRIKGSRKGTRKNKDGSESTHLMADNNKDTAWPTLFQDEKGHWYHGGYEEAKRRGEIYKFDSKKELIDFARKGNWKNTYQGGGWNFNKTNTYGTSYSPDATDAINNPGVSTQSNYYSQENIKKRQKNRPKVNVGDAIDVGLSIAGLTPGIGIIPDAINAIQNTGQAAYNYLTGDKEEAQKDWTNAKWAMAGMIPAGIGQTATGAKLINATNKGFKKVKSIAKSTKTAIKETPTIVESIIKQGGNDYKSVKELVTDPNKGPYTTTVRVEPKKGTKTAQIRDEFIAKQNIKHPEQAHVTGAWVNVPHPSQHKFNMLVGHDPSASANFYVNKWGRHNAKTLNTLGDDVTLNLSKTSSDPLKTLYTDPHASKMSAGHAEGSRWSPYTVNPGEGILQPNDPRISGKLDFNIKGQGVPGTPGYDPDFATKTYDQVQSILTGPNVTSKWNPSLNPNFWNEAAIGGGAIVGGTIGAGIGGYSLLRDKKRKGGVRKCKYGCW